MYDGTGVEVRQTTAAGTTDYFGPSIEWSAKTVLVNFIYAAGMLVARRANRLTQWSTTDPYGITPTDDRCGRQNRRAPGLHAFRRDVQREGDWAADRLRRTRTSRSDRPHRHERAPIDPALGRMISPDTIIPELTNTEALNPYSYVYNNPLSYTDPTGHYIQPNPFPRPVYADYGNPGGNRGGDWFNAPCRRKLRGCPIWATGELLLAAGDAARNP